MTDATPRLGLDYLMTNQAQKHVTLNGSLWRLDGLVQLRLESRTLATPPGTPEDGACWLTPASPAGDWAGFDPGVIVRRDGLDWTALPVPAGAVAWVADEAQVVVLTDEGWTPLGALLAEIGPVARLGVGRAPDADLPLVVEGPGVLLDADADGDHRLMLNRTAGTDTASVLFQTGYQGAAEVGLCGDGALSFRRSADGVSWTTTLTLAADGHVGVNRTSPVAMIHAVSENSDPGLQVDAVLNATAGANFTGTKARGTVAAPTGVASGDRLFSLVGRGWTSAGAMGGNAGVVQMLAAEAFTATAQGTAITFETTPLGSTTRRAVVRFQPSGAVRLMPMTAAPVSPEAGDFYFDSTLGQFRGWTGSAWTVLG